MGLSHNSTINETYAVGQVTDPSLDSGGLLGGQAGTTLGISFFDSTVNPTLGAVGSASTTSGGTGASTTALMKSGTYTAAPYDWNFSTIWGISSHRNQGFPYLADLKSTYLNTAGQVPEVPWAGALPLAGIAAAASIFLRRRTGPVKHRG